MSRSWTFFRAGEKDDTVFLHHDYQPPSTPSSKVNLQRRFEMPTVSRELQYENWIPTTERLNNINSGKACQRGDKIYENQQEILDHNLAKMRRCTRPPPLPPRNSVLTSNCLNTANSNANNTLYVENSADEPMDEDPVPGDGFWQDCAESDDSSNGFQSRSSSFLPRFSVRGFSNIQKHTFNKALNHTFCGAENVYTSVLDNKKKAAKEGLHPILQSVQGNAQNKPKGNKLFKLSGNKLSQAVQGCRTAISSISQKFIASTQRRYRLNSGSSRSGGFGTPPHSTIRRTPGKLYSPFNCSTPPAPKGYEAKRLQHRLSKVGYAQEIKISRTPRGLRTGQCSTDTQNEFPECLVSCPCGSENQNCVHSRLGPQPLKSWNSRNTNFHQQQPLNFSGREFAKNSPIQHQRSASNIVFGSSGSHPQIFNYQHFRGKSTVACSPSLSRHEGGSQPKTPVRARGDTTLNFNGPNAQDNHIFQRHLVEFDQMSRNITVSLSRNSRYRSSVR